MKKIFLYLILALLLTNNQLFAVKAYPHPIAVTQSDGTIITIKMHGDEFFNYTTTEDGYLIKQDEKGIYRYTKFNNGKFELLDQKANNVNKRDLTEKQLNSKLEKNPEFSSTLLTRRAQRINKTRTNTTLANQFPVIGSPRSLVILVNFSDKSYVTPTPKTAFTDLLNKVGYSTNGGTGSARDYFIESSFGQFSPQFDVIGPFTLPQNMEYYGKNNSNGDDQNPQQLAIDACASANSGGVDFTIYDTDNNGVVDNIFVYYAGYNEAEGATANTIWPHRWSLANYNTKFDGKTIFDYACTSELRGSNGTTMCGIGTFTHEFGHVLGLVDYYHTTEDKNTLENWSIMDGGAYSNQGRTPPSYSSYDRFYLGWLTPSELKSPQNVTIQPLLSSNKAFLISQNGNHNLNGANPVSSEFFMIENRQKSGFDAYLPGAGMLVWHIDYDASAWNNNEPNNYTGTTQTAGNHMRVYLQPLSGQTATPGAAFTSGSYKPTLWNGTNTNKPITAINVTNGVVGFKFMGGTTIINAPIAKAATEIKKGSFVANWSSANNAKGYYLTAYSISEGESTYTESFDKGLETPVEWKLNVNGTTTSINFSGKSIPALILKNNNDSIQTETYPSAVKKLSFYLKSMSSFTNKLIVKGWNGISWKFINEINVNTGMDVTLNLDINQNNNFTKFKFSYYSASGTTIAIDDISVTFAENVEYISKNKWKENLTDTLYNLVSERMHYYKVIASDVAFYKDNTKIYEILSAFSNTISLETLPYNDAKKVRTERDLHTNDMLVFLEDLNQNVLIYNTSGQLVANIKPTDLKVNITNYLRPHNIYIISVGIRFNKIIF